jgi:glycine/D-amino acid oxidase-like deaminating enzyme
LAGRAYDVAVIGGGVFGAWTAERLRVLGQRVLLVDAWGPGHARASSGGESRLIRTAYGADDIYTHMALDSLPDWRALSDREALPLFHPTGVLFAFGRDDAYAADTLRLHRGLGIPIEALDRADLARRYPQADWLGVEHALLEPGGGVLMARRGVRTLVEAFVSAGGDYRQDAVAPPSEGPMPDRLDTASGEPIVAGRFVFACGPWLPRLFPDLLGGRIFRTRQEIFFFAPPPGDDRFGPARLPGWIDFNAGEMIYGMPDLEGRGFKIADDRHGPPIDPDHGDRTASAAGLAHARAYMARRFPALADAQLVETRVCQYENSSNGDFLIDRHPDWANVLLVGAGSGHGFKHGPAVGRLAAELCLDPGAPVEPRFSLATKGETHQRSVH